MSRHERLSPERLEQVQEVSRLRPVETDAPVTTSPTGVRSDAPRKRRSRALLSILGIFVLGAGGYAGERYWTDGRWMIETDDAYVQADIALISSRVQGYVADVEVDANQQVSAGDVLVRLDDGDYRIALDTAESRVETAGQTLTRIDAQIDAARAAVAEAEAGRDAAEAQLRAASSSAERVRSLAAGKVVAQVQLDSANEALDTATANLAKARATVASAEAQVAVLQAQRAEAEGTRHELELAVAQARRDLELTVLRAPANGTVTNLALEVGDLVAPGARLAALVPNHGLYVEANYKETQMEGIAPGATVRVTFDALPDREFEGRVASTAPATGSVFSLLPADNATGNFTKIVQRIPVRIELPEAAIASGQLRAGLSAVVTVDSRTSPAADAAGFVAAE